MSKYTVLVPLNKSELSQEILPYIEQFLSPQENSLILLYLTNPPKGSGFVVPDPSSNYALEPGGEPLGPKPHPIYASQEEDNIKAHVETA
ncbi:MAG TPA: hypothetical protein ENJ56_06075, partial [Anaerolineae bacterium]|nr:hypothetical protein [Anaerolineae bacterium]